MKKVPKKITAAESIRRKAETILRKQSLQGRSASEADLHKLYHELEVHQIELELQNKELISAKENLEGLISERRTAEEKIKRILLQCTRTNEKLEELIQLNNEKDLFISVLAHDLRNPLGVLIGYSEALLENKPELSDENRNYIDAISASSHNTFSLLEDLLRWSRIRVGKFPFELQVVDFRNICNDVLGFFNSLALRKNIQLNCSSGDHLSLYADIEMLKAVIRNLVSNAIKFTDKNGTIVVSVNQTNTDIVFSVSDNGIGIDPERLNKLFDISGFHSTNGTENEKGTGLGLLICKEFVEKHGGKIWAESEYGRGSTFYFNIPVKITSKIKDSEDHNQIRKLNILIADNEAGLRMLLGTIIRDFSKEIFYAETGTEAVAIFKGNPDIDLILLDYHMPEMNGFEAAHQIRSFNKDVVIILVTADTYSELHDDARRSGINDFFFKPYNRNFLKELIIKHFKK